MEKVRFLEVGHTLVYLSACALHSVVPDEETVKSVDLRELLHVAARHSMQVIIAMALESAVAAYPRLLSVMDKETLDEFKLIKAQAIRKKVLFDAELQKLLEFMEQNGIFYMPLKGLVLQSFYPRFGMRQMCVNDIFFDINYRKDIRSFMIANGYEVIKYNSGYPDAYRKNGMFLFEMHFSLYNETDNEIEFNRYYKDVKHKLVKDESNGFGYHFTDEDFYIHCLSHSYKHFSHGGNGVRSLMDIFVFLLEKHSKLDWCYIDAELLKLGIVGFERMMRALAFKCFERTAVDRKSGTASLSEKERQMLDFLISSGVYGTVQNRIEQMVDEYGQSRVDKVKYAIRRLFPSMGYYKVNYPFCYKTRVLIPFVAVWRIIKRSIVNSKSIKREILLLIKKK